MTLSVPAKRPIKPVYVMKFVRLVEELKAELRLRAARHGRSAEAEARVLLRDVLTSGTAPAPAHLADLALTLFGPNHGAELPALPPRSIC